VDAFRGQPFAGEVVQVRKAAQISQGVVSYVVVVSARNASLKLLPGMTANVRIIVAHRASALKVPNAALRFLPPATETEDTTGATLAGASTDTPATAGSDDTRGRVWVRGADGRPRPVALRLGLTDGTFTEVLDAGGLEGDEVLVGVADPRSSRSTRARWRL
jgi:HlyD family secretion protein